MHIQDAVFVTLFVVIVWLMSRPGVLRNRTVKSLDHALPGYLYLPDSPNSIVAEYAHEYAAAQLNAAAEIWTCMRMCGKPDLIYADVKHY